MKKIFGYWALLLVLSFPSMGFSQVLSPSERIFNWLHIPEEDLVLRAENSNKVIGYAKYFQRNHPQPADKIAVFASGFDAASSEPADPGTLKSAFELADQLSLEVRRNQPKIRNFVTSLTDMGYGVWVIDYKDRNATVRVNSEVLQAFLKTPEYIRSLDGRFSAIFGYSMGGVIARHALLTMEDESLKHNAGAYISLDSPHRGAFLPPALEVVGRTMNTLTYGGALHAVYKKALREETTKIIKTYNSAAAKELLGIYMGSGAPRLKTRDKRKLSGAFKSIRNHYSNLTQNTDLARHPSFFAIREELVQLGGYPANTLNIGVSFGPASGDRLQDFRLRPAESAWFKAESGGTKLVELRFKSTAAGYNLCKVDLIGRSVRVCPPLFFRNQDLQEVFTSPGSTAPGFGVTLETLIDNTDVNTPFGTGIATIIGSSFVLPQAQVPAALPASFWLGWMAGVGVNSRGLVEQNEQQLTFIPMVSAFDDKGWAATYPQVPLQRLNTPFDQVIANTDILATINRTHAYYSDSGEVFDFQKVRVGPDRSAKSPTSSYWSAIGEFDLLRYTTEESILDFSTPRIRYDIQDSVAATLSGFF